MDQLDLEMKSELLDQFAARSNCVAVFGFEVYDLDRLVLSGVATHWVICFIVITLSVIQSFLLFHYLYLPTQDGKLIK